MSDERNDEGDSWIDTALCLIFAFALILFGIGALITTLYVYFR